MIDLKGWNDPFEKEIPLNKEIFALLEDKLRPAVIIAKKWPAKRLRWTDKTEGELLCYDVPDGNYHCCNGSHIKYWKSVEKPIITEKDAIIAKILTDDNFTKEEKDLIVTSLKNLSSLKNETSVTNSGITNLDSFEASEEIEIVKIGNQKWMKKNLDLTDDGFGKDHWENPDNGEMYYTWSAARRLARKVPGFHLPTAEEWNELADACGAVCRNPNEKISGWKTYDNIQELKNKLGIKLVGYYFGIFRYVGSYAYFWTSTEYSSASAYFRGFRTSSSMCSDYNGKGCSYSVRLVADS